MSRSHYGVAWARCCDLSRHPAGAASFGFSLVAGHLMDRISSSRYKVYRQGMTNASSYLYHPPSFASQLKLVVRQRNLDNPPQVEHTQSPSYVLRWRLAIYSNVSKQSFESHLNVICTPSIMTFRLLTRLCTHYERNSYWISVGKTPEIQGFITWN